MANKDGSSQGGGGILGTLAAVFTFIVTGSPQAAMWAYQIGSTVGNLLAPPTGPDQFGPRLDSLTITTSTNVATLPRAYGTVAHKGNIIWAKDDEYVEVTTVKKVKTGLFSKTKVTTYSYFFSGAIAFARSEATAFLRVWHQGGNDLVYSATSTDLDTQIASAEFLKYVTFYYGTDDQDIDPLMAEDVGEASCSAYPGVIYLVYNMYPLEKYQNSIGMLDPKVEYTTKTTTASDLELLANVPADSEGTDQDLHDGLHNATNINAEGVHVWRIGRAISPAVNYTETAERFHYTALPSGELLLRQIHQEDTFQLDSDEQYHPYTKACHGKSDRNVFVSTKGFIRQGPPGEGGSVSHPSLMQYGDWSVTLYGALWTLPLNYSVSTLYAGMQSVLANEGGGPGIAGTPEYMFESAEQIADAYSVLWRDPVTHIGRYVIYSDSPIKVTLPITSEMFYGDGGYFFVRFELSVLDEDNDTDLTHVIHVDASNGIPSENTHYAFYNNVTYFLYYYADRYVIVRINELGGRREQVHSLSGESVVKMGVLNDELIVVVTDGTNCNFDIYDIEDLELDDNKDSSEVTALFGASTSALYNNISFDFDKVYFCQSGNLKVKSSLTAAAETIGAHTGMILGTSPSLFNIFGAGSLIADSTIGGIMPNVGVQFFSYGIVADPGKVLLADIIVAENALVGIEESDLDVTTIDQQVRGYVVSEIGPVRNVLSQLQAIFPFDVIQHGYKNAYVKRGLTSVATVSWEDLGPGPSLTQDREMETQLPYKVELTYIDYDLDYQPNVQFAERRNDSKNIVRLNIPIVLTASEAAQAAEILLNIYHLERRTFAFVLPPTYRNLEPSDIITLQMKDVTYVVRLTNIHYLANGQMECTAKQHRETVYVSTAQGASPEVTPPTTIPSIANPILGVLDIPVINDAQNKAGYTALVSHQSETWIGGSVYRARDGVTYEMVQAFSAETVWGTCQDTLSAHGGHLIDLGGSLTVKPHHGGVMPDFTEAEMLNEESMLAYGQPGRWELICYQNTTDNMDGTHTIDTFLRGRRGTEWASGLHQPGDYFAFVNDGTAKFISALNTDIDQTLKHKAITTGRDLDSSSVVSLPYGGENLTPRSPVQASGYRDSSDNFFGQFIPRTRLDGGLSMLDQIYMGAPMGEATEVYEIDVMDGADVLRTIAVSEPEFEYPAADQVTDFGSEQPAIDFNIYQISAVVGRGHVGAFTL